MAAELGLLSLTQLQKLARQQLQNSDSIGSRCSTTYWMWNPKQVSQEQDDSWEVKAFEQDTSNITWPPRSYSCTFCRREFRSAQALGGHMNVHRRDRARLHQTPPTGTNNPTIISSSSSTLLIPAQEFVTNGGLCVLYSLPSPNGVLSPNTVNSCMDSPSNFLSTSSPFEANNLIPPCPPITLPQSINNSSIFHESSNTEPSASNSNDNNIPDNGEIKKDSAIEELDLELRLGRR